MSWLIVVGIALVALLVYDLVQREHAILRTFPLIGHFRYILESVGPELRQYIVTDNDEERPFTRDQRRWVYASAKRQNNYFGFGTDNDLETSANYLVIKHSAFPYAPPRRGSSPDDPMYPIPCAKIIGAARGRKRAFRPASVINISAMSFGSLSRAAVEALNRGAKLAGCMQNTGEGGISRYHDHGGELIWQIGTGYFGCRRPDGRFDLDALVDKAARYKVRMIEIKLSQGAKPGHGGVLPGVKVTPEIAAIRGVPVGQTCLSPPRHSAFSDVDGLLDFVERIADATGLPVGIKSAVGELDFWRELAEKMADGQRGVDYIQIDGSEGGTGAAPLVFADHVSLPFKVALSRVYRVFAERGVADRVVWIGSGRLGFPEQALFAFALGCDMVAIAREALLSIGCIQAQRCHTGNCPTGVTSQRPWLVRGLDPMNKAARFANYVATLRRELLELSHACGVPHPALVGLDHFEIVDDRFGSRPAAEVFHYAPGWGLPPVEARATLIELMGAQTPSTPAP